MKVQDILETVIYANDLEAAEEFYTNILGLTFVAGDEGKFVYLRCSNRMFLIFNPEATASQSHLPPHGAQGDQHVAFAVPAAELNQWQKHLESKGVQIERDVHWENGSRSLYFRDPAKNSVELASPLIWNLPDVAGNSVQSLGDLFPLFACLGLGW
jgi:catechol 2,3-dioxygenase-like lactoylglutathione lyase family enzyme